MFHRKLRFNKLQIRWARFGREQIPSSKSYGLILFQQCLCCCATSNARLSFDVQLLQFQDRLVFSLGHKQCTAGIECVYAQSRNQCCASVLQWRIGNSGLTRRTLECVVDWRCGVALFVIIAQQILPLFIQFFFSFSLSFSIPVELHRFT